MNRRNTILLPFAKLCAKFPNKVHNLIHSGLSKAVTQLHSSSDLDFKVDYK